jgi:hypothetical protein
MRSRYFEGEKGAPPVGAEHPSESSGKSMIESSGAAESAALAADPILIAVVDAWPTLSESTRRGIAEIIADGKE